MAIQINEDVQKVLDIIGDTPENREKLLPIVEELQTAGKSRLKEKDETEEKAKPPEEEDEEEKQAKKPEDDEEEEEEKKQAKPGGLIGAIVDKLTALKGKVPDANKAAVTEIIELARNLRRASRYPYPEAKEVADVLRTGVLEELRQGLEDTVSGLFSQYAQRVESLEGQVKEGQEFSSRFRELLASQPKSTLRPSEAEETKVAEDDKTLQALKSEGEEKKQVLPGFIGRTMREPEE